MMLTMAAIMAGMGLIALLLICKNPELKQQEQEQT